MERNVVNRCGSERLAWVDARAKALVDAVVDTVQASHNPPAPWRLSTVWLVMAESRSLATSTRTCGRTRSQMARYRAWRLMNDGMDKDRGWGR